jgi:hypothetical protein
MAQAISNTFFLLQHVVLAIKFAVSYAIPDIPEWVEDEIAKVEYKRREAEKAEKVCFAFDIYI